MLDADLLLDAGADAAADKSDADDLASRTKLSKRMVAEAKTRIGASLLTRKEAETKEAAMKEGQ